MPTFQGQLDSTGDARFAIVASRFNEMITSRLVEGATNTLAEHGIEGANVDVAWCPGAFEIPLVARSMATSGRYSAVICVGAVIRGDTPHFDYVARGVATGIQQGMLESGIPVMFGVLTVDTIEQALERAGTGVGNKGAEAALGALEMANLLQQLRVD